ncbi:hypothetical protein C5952_21720 [Cronobacter sakazakii]|nr:hypothetical protein CSSP291_13035 [Cronobacter sakazakii SP291]ALB51404.1 hypothetical protein AFK64_12810 [Cronobacter sakazakii]EGT4406621.1 hypothetical protein [Cronobacter sakazakii]EGT4427364.1 hypothetical protein [Cronobacter sakazakii]EGT4440345.1 hypothetical protein [Cronobacter sakazakii]
MTYPLLFASYFSMWDRFGTLTSKVVFISTRVRKERLVMARQMTEPLLQRLMPSNQPVGWFDLFPR